MAAKKKPAAQSKTPAKPEPAKSEPAKKSATSASSSASSAPAPQPLIDTNLAANAAAAMIGGKVSSPANQAAGAKKESAAFKQLKAGLNKPSAGALGGVFGNPAQQKKSRQAFGGGKQIGHNQTFGSDASRTGVPRRTPG